MLHDEINLYKLKNRIFVTSIEMNFPNNPIYRLRQTPTFRLPPVSNNVEYYSPILRMHRNHMEYFNELDVYEPCFRSFKRYALHEINQIQNAMIEY